MDEITVSRHAHGRFWVVRDAAGELICICVYKRGAMEVARRFSLAPALSPPSASKTVRLRHLLRRLKNGGEAPRRLPLLTCLSLWTEPR